MAIAGLVVGAIGLVVSAIALVVAIWQIRKTQTAANSAAAAATEAREAVQGVTSISDLSQITVEMDLLGELHRRREWKRAIDKYSSLERSLTRARASLPGAIAFKISIEFCDDSVTQDEPEPVRLCVCGGPIFRISPESRAKWDILVGIKQMFRQNAIALQVFPLDHMVNSILL